MGIPALDESLILAMREDQFLNNFMFIIMDNTAIGGYEAIKNEAASVLNNAVNITGFAGGFINTALMVKSIELPMSKFATELKGDIRRVYTKFEPFENFKMEIYDTVWWNTYTYLRSWLNTIYDCQNNVFRTVKSRTNDARYKTGILIPMRGTPQIVPGVVEPTYAPSASFLYENLRIVGIDTINFDKEDQGKVLSYNVELMCDSIKNVVFDQDFVLQALDNLLKAFKSGNAVPVNEILSTIQFK